MRDVTEWIRGTLASRRKAKRQPRGNVVLGAVLHNIIAERANHGLLVVTDGTERLSSGDDQSMHVLEDEQAAAVLFVGSTTEPSPGASLLASRPGFPRLPFAEDGVFIVDAESGRVLEALPLAGQPFINDAVVQNTDASGCVGILTAFPAISRRTRLLRQARERVKELATANHRKDEFLATLSHELRSPLA